MCLLNEHYEPLEAQRAKQLLFNPVETSFLQSNYVAPEAHSAAVKLTNPGTNPRSFFNEKQRNANGFMDILKNVIRHYEQSGRPPRTDVYDDGKGIPTIATGLALHDGNKDFVCHIISEALLDKNLDRDTRLKMADLIRLEWKNQLGREASVITQEQANQLEEVMLKYKITALCESNPKINKDIIQDGLKPHQIAVLISLKTNGVMGKNLARYINAGDFDAAYTEIRERSCGERNKLHEKEARKTVVGLQLRREKEAHLFKTGQMISDQQAYALLLENPSNQAFLKTLDVVERIAQKTTQELRKWAREFTGLYNVFENSKNVMVS